MDISANAGKYTYDCRLGGMHMVPSHTIYILYSAQISWVLNFANFVKFELFTKIIQRKFGHISGRFTELGEFAKFIQWIFKIAYSRLFRPAKFDGIRNYIGQPLTKPYDMQDEIIPSLQWECNCRQIRQAGRGPIIPRIAPQWIDYNYVELL